jgi:hypothetical protein
MYQTHFGLASLPFTITPDTGFFHNAGTHQEALNVLLVALRTGEGFIKVTGEVGTGKTLLCRQLLNNLEADFVTAYIPNPFLNPTALRMALAEELGIEFARNIGQHRLLKLITERLVELNAAGKRVVLLLDEAQAMPDDSLEALRLLTNLETEHDKLMQVVLFGQPELDRRLGHRTCANCASASSSPTSCSPWGSRACVPTWTTGCGWRATGATGCSRSGPCVGCTAPVAASRAWSMCCVTRPCWPPTGAATGLSTIATCSAPSPIRKMPGRPPATGAHWRAG